MADVAALVDAHGAGRRRATFHARFATNGEAHVGFMKARAHEIVDLDACPILAPQMAGALAGGAGHCRLLFKRRAKPLDMLVTATLTGLDVDIRGHGPLTPDHIAALIRVAEAQDLARLSNHGVLVIERRAPLLRMGKAELAPPPGAFLQATEEGEAALAEAVVTAFSGAARARSFRRRRHLFAAARRTGRRSMRSTAIAAALAALARAAREQPESAARHDRDARSLPPALWQAAELRPMTPSSSIRRGRAPKRRRGRSRPLPCRLSSPSPAIRRALRAISPSSRPAAMRSKA